MLIPRDRPVYTNLSTSFIAFEELIRDLATRRLTGALRLSAPGYSGLILFAEGEALNALAEQGGPPSSGLAAANQVAARAQAKDGSISVYALSGELVQLLARAVEGELLYGGLSTSFTSLEKLFANLQGASHTGYLEITFADGSGVAMIFLESGTVVDAVLVAGGQSAAGPDVVESILQSADAAGATCDVFRAVAADGAVAAGQAVGTTLAQGDILAAWEDILAGTEEVVDGLGAPGLFSLAFKETLLDHATEYPFLDPFAAELNYRDGKLTYEGTLPADLSQALGECLADTVARLAFRLKRADLERRIRERHQGIAERHGEAFRRIDLAACTQELIA